MAGRLDMTQVRGSWSGSQAPPPVASRRSPPSPTRSGAAPRVGVVTGGKPAVRSGSRQAVTMVATKRRSRCPPGHSSCAGTHRRPPSPRTSIMPPSSWLHRLGHRDLRCPRTHSTRRDGANSDGSERVQPPATRQGPRCGPAPTDADARRVVRGDRSGRGRLKKCAVLRWWSNVGEAVVQLGDNRPRCGVDGKPEHVGTVVVADRVEQTPP